MLCDYIVLCNYKAIAQRLTGKINKSAIFNLIIFHKCKKAIDTHGMKKVLYVIIRGKIIKNYFVSICVKK